MVPRGDALLHGGRGSDVRQDGDPGALRALVSGERMALEGISDELEDLIDGMLKVSASERFTLDEVAAHPWFAAGPPQSGGGGKSKERSAPK